MSWLNLSGNLSNLSGNLSSFTDHISSFTKEVLTETTEEVYDHEAELNLSKTKIKELDAKLEKQRSEWERLTKLNEELREKAESSELQIQAISSEYRKIIEKKDNEIKELRKVQIELQRQNSRDASRNRHDSSSKDAIDFEDPEFLQIELEKLKRELSKVKADCNHWKQVATNQNTEAELKRLKEEHQQETISLQSMYSQRISQINKKHKQEVERLTQEMNALNDCLQELEAEQSKESSSHESSKQRQHLKDVEENYQKSLMDLDNKDRQILNIQNQLLKQQKIRENLEAELDNQKNILEKQVMEKDTEIIKLKEEVGSLKMKLEVDEARLKESNGKEGLDIEDNRRIYDEENESELQATEEKWSSKYEQILKELEQGKIEYEKCVSELEHSKDENVSLTLEYNKLHEQFQDCRADRDKVSAEFENLRIENYKLCIEKEKLKESEGELEELKSEINRLGSCTVELLDELEYSKGVQEEQEIEIESLRKICQIKGEPADEIKKLQKGLRGLGERYVELWRRYQKVSLELRTSNDRLLKEYQLRHENTKEFRKEISMFRQRLKDGAEKKLTACREEKDVISNQVDQLTQQVSEHEVFVADLEVDSEFVSRETRNLVADFGCQTNVSSSSPPPDQTAETIESLVAEKAILERTIEGLERRAGSLQELVDELQTGKTDVEVEKISNESTEVKSVGTRDAAFSPVSIFDSVTSEDGSYFEDEHPQTNRIWQEDDSKQQNLKKEIQEPSREVRILQGKLAEYKAELQAFENIRKDWEFEKETLENVVIDLQKKLKLAREDEKEADSSSHDSSANVGHKLSGTEISSLDWDDFVDAREISKNLREQNEHLKVLLSNIDQVSTEIIYFLVDALERRTGTSPSHSNLQYSSEQKVMIVKELVESFISECSGETDAEKWQKKFEEVSNERAALVEEVSAINSSLQSYTDKYNNLLDERNSLLESVDILSQDLELMTQGQSALLSEKEQLQSELDKLQFQLDTNETDDSKEIGELKMQLNDLKIEREGLIKMVNERDEAITEQQEKYESMLDQLTEEKDRDLLQLQEQQEQIMELFKEKQRECEVLKSQQKIANSDFTAVQEESRKKDNELLELSKEVVESFQKLNDQSEKHEAVVSNFELERQELLNKLEDLQASFNSKVDQEKVNLLADEVGELSTSLSEKTSQIKELEEEISLYENERQRTAQELSELRDENKQLQDKVLSLNDSFQELNEQLTVGQSMDLSKQEREPPTPQTDNNENVSTIPVQEEVVSVKEEETLSMNPEQNNLEISSIDVSQDVTDSYKYKELDNRLLENEKFISDLKSQLSEKDRDLEKFKIDMKHLMEVLKSKDELLLNLEMMETNQLNSDERLPLFSSRARVIQYIREKEAEIQYIKERNESLEEIVTHHGSQIEIFKVERQNLLIRLQEKELEIVELKERMENIQARSTAKEHASTVLHSEHKKLLELNQSQGAEIARMREKNQFLQKKLEEAHGHSVVEMARANKIQELETEIAAFQQEEERLLTLVHVKNSDVSRLEKELQNCKDQISTLNIEIQTLKKQNLEFEKRCVRPRNASESVSLDEHSAKPDLNVTEEGIIKPEVISYVEISRLESAQGSDTDKERDQLMFEIQSLKAELVRKDDEIQTLGNENSVFVKELSELKHNCEMLENEKQNIIVQHENAFKETKLQVKNLATKNKDLEEILNNMNEDKEHERKKLNQGFEARTKILVQDWEEKVRLKEAEIKSCNEKLALLATVQEQLKKSDVSDSKSTAEIGLLRAENAKLKALYGEKQQEISVLQADVHRYKNIITATEVALNKMQTDNKYVADELEKKKASIKELDNHKILLEQKIQELEAEVRRLTVACRETEAKAAKEMERLRNHLVDVEESYTNEIVACQDRERDLQEKFEKVFGELKQRTTDLQDSSQHSSNQIQSLQQQLYALASQRDATMLQLSQAREQVHQKETALENLQMALEQLQRDKDSQYELLTEQAKKQITEANKHIEDLRKKENQFQSRIQEATLAVQGVSSLSKQLKDKEEEIEKLRKDVERLSSSSKRAEQAMKELKEAMDGKIDKELMKNLLNGYFHTPENKRQDVVRVIGNLVGFTHEEIDQFGSGAPPKQTTWVSAILPFGGNTSPVPTNVTRKSSHPINQLGKSFTELFVSFLEEESGNKSRPSSNQLTSLLMDQPTASSTPSRAIETLSGSRLQDMDGTHAQVQQKNTAAVSNPLLITSDDVKAAHRPQFKTQLPYLPALVSSPPPLFPAPGQEIPRVHTSTANSALRTMLGS